MKFASGLGDVLREAVPEQRTKVPAAVTLSRNTQAAANTLLFPRATAAMMRYLALSVFLTTHRGYYRETCLAQLVPARMDDVRARVGKGEWGDIVIAYRLCRNCLAEQEVVGHRARS